MGYDERFNDYVDVAERIRIFRAKYPNGSLQPANPAEPFQIVTVADQTFVVYVAAAYRDPDDKRPGIGSAWEPVPGRTPYTRLSELANAESSAWGRAIVATLAADTKRIASAEEVRNRKAPERSSTNDTGEEMASASQLAKIKALHRAAKRPDPDDLSTWTAERAEKHLALLAAQAIGVPKPQRD